MGKDKYYWIPAADQFEKMRQHGQVFALYRRGFCGIKRSCDLPLSFDPARQRLIVLLQGYPGDSGKTDDSKRNLYLSTESRELDKLVELEKKDQKHRSLSAYMTALKPFLVDRLNKRGLHYMDLIRANADRVPLDFRAVFQTALDRIIDKYFVQP